MEQVISSALFEKFPEAKMIIDELVSKEAELKLTDSVLYFGFPKFYGYEEVDNVPDLLLLSKSHGLFVLRFDNESPLKFLSLVENQIDDLYSLIFSRLNESRALRARRGQIIFPCETFLYETPGCRDKKSESIVTSIESIIDILKKMETSFHNLLSDEQFLECRAILEGTKALAEKTNRIYNEEYEDSKAFILEKLEAEIKTFDFQQRASAISIIEGPQRIRGLAGSGKTVVLAMKAAHIHMTEPNAIILFTFYTKSLYDHVKNLITLFYRHFKKIDPNWTKLQIKHAWGGKGVDGVYYSACVNNGVPPTSFKEAQRFNYQKPFDYICEELVKANIVRPLYDYVLIDEAQDIPVYFFRLVYQLTKGERDKKNIIWGYDELQNIFKVKSRTPRELFGSDEEDSDIINLDRSIQNLPTYLKNDIVLKKCYRNPLPILISAHALGFGIYNDENSPPVQMLESREHWEDLGYNVVSGTFEVGTDVVIERPAHNSPLSISRYCGVEEILQYYTAKNFEDEKEWIIQQIRLLLENGLQPEDILVIALDDKNARDYFKSITKMLLRENIFVNNVLLNPYNSTYFKKEGTVTLSTIHRAKGNESSAVIVIGIDALYFSRNSRFSRNKIFTAFTRAKAFLRISGIGEGAEYFFHEIDEALKNSPQLKFKQPSRDEVEMLQRDISDRTKKIEELKETFNRELDFIGLSEEEKEQFFKDNL